LDLLKPHTAKRVESKQLQQKTKHDATAKSRVVCVGDTVFVKNFGGGNRWLAGKVIKKTGPVSFHIRLDDGRYRRCHQEQLRFRVTDEGPEMREVGVDNSVPETEPVPIESAATEMIQTDASTTHSPTEVAEPAAPPEVPHTTTRNYPRRQRKPREWFEPGKN
jgi:hypothetical protein